MSQSAFIRHATYDMQGSDRTLRIKKWSASKFIAIATDVADVIDDAMTSLDGDASDRKKLYTRLTVAFCRKSSKLNRVICESVDDPKLTDAEVGDWDMEDTLGVLAEILKLNLTDALQKKVIGLLQAALPMSPQEALPSAPVESVSNSPA